jgi:hypothetical protein
VAENHHLAVAQLQRDLMSDISNPLVIPPLTYATLRSLSAAARSDSLAEISDHFDLAATAYMAAQQTGRVSSHWWSQRGARFRSEFLWATDAIGPWPRLAAWSADETGFADGSAISDPGLTLALSAIGIGSSIGVFADTAHIRMLVAHSLSASINWETVTPFDGVFERGVDDMIRLPLLRLSAGVTRHSRSDFVADVIRSADLQVMTIRPSSGTLQDFATNRLEAALADAVEALLADGATPPVGEMLLPQMDLALPLQADGPLRSAGVLQVFDETFANLRGLDGIGGIYAQVHSPAGALRIAPDGLALQAGDAIAFTFSPHNVNGGGSASAGLTASSGSYFQCVWPAPDLRAFFLVVLDKQGWVVALAAIDAPPGTQVTPQCTL